MQEKHRPDKFGDVVPPVLQAFRLHLKTYETQHHLKHIINTNQCFNYNQLSVVDKSINREVEFTQYNKQTKPLNKILSWITPTQG